LQRTPRGRIATRRAYEHLGLPYTEKNAAGSDPNAPEQGRLW
jgi:Holliday junction DNA helicase RuvB